VRLVTRAAINTRDCDQQKADEKRDSSMQSTLLEERHEKADEMRDCNHPDRVPIIHWLTINTPYPPINFHTGIQLAYIRNSSYECTDCICFSYEYKNCKAFEFVRNDICFSSILLLLLRVCVSIATTAITPVNSFSSRPPNLEGSIDCQNPNNSRPVSKFAKGRNDRSYGSWLVKTCSPSSLCI
jgi:hypothetical protein